MLVDGVSSGFCIQICPQAVGVGNVLRCILLKSATPSMGGNRGFARESYPVGNQTWCVVQWRSQLAMDFCLNPRFSKRSNPGVASRIRSCR